jgi:tetratricopeptide (TPR) repeat protein/transcriptional regulator with XRE-family HTH domain
MGRRDKGADTHSLGARMRHVRQQKGISLTELSERLQYSKSYLSMIEMNRTRPSSELVKLYERELGLRQGELMDMFNEMAPVGGSAPSQTLSSTDIASRDQSTSLSETSKRESLRKIPFDGVLLLEPSNFVGRNDDLAWVLEQLRPGGTMRIAALRGLGGIGKTSLASVAIRRLHDEHCFPDGIAVVVCQDLKDAADVLHRILSRFDPQHRESETSDFTDLSEITHRLLHGKKALIVLDSLQPELAIEQVIAPLRAAGVALLLTSRHVLSPTAIPIEATRKLDLLLKEDALELFARSLGKKEVADLDARERTAAERIVRALDRHTLAVKLAGINAFISLRDLEALADELASPLGAFDLFEDDMPHAVRQVFSRSLEALSEEAQQLFASLAAFTTTDFGRQAVIALGTGLGISMPEALYRLIRHSLIDGFSSYEMPRQISDFERQRLHLLLRALAVTEFERWSDKRQQLAYETLARYYADYARKLLDAAPNLEAMATACDPDMTNIHASLQWAYTHQQYQLVMSICDSMQHVWGNRWLTDDSLHYLPWGIEAARTISETTQNREDRLCLAQLCLSYGYVLQLTSGAGAGQSLESARSYYKQSLTIARELHDRRIEGIALHQLGRVVRKLGDLEQAERHYHEALPILREIQNQREEAWTLAFLGQIKRDRGELEEAEQFYQDALTIHRQVGDQRGESWDLGYLGQLALTYGHLDEAKEYYEQYLELAEKLKDRRSKGTCLSFLGEIALAEQEYETARLCLQQARSIFNSVKDLQSEGWALNLLGQVAQAQDVRAEAWELLQDALGKLQDAKDVRGECLVRTSLARIAELRNDLDTSEQLYRQSFTLCQKIPDFHVVANTRLELGRFLIEHGDKRSEGCSIITATMQLFDGRSWVGKEEVQDRAQKLLQAC